MGAKVVIHVSIALIGNAVNGMECWAIQFIGLLKMETEGIAFERFLIIPAGESNFVFPVLFIGHIHIPGKTVFGNRIFPAIDYGFSIAQVADGGK